MFSYAAWRLLGTLGPWAPFSLNVDILEVVTHPYAVKMIQKCEIYDLNYADNVPALSLIFIILLLLSVEAISLDLDSDFFIFLCIWILWYDE